MRCCNCYCCYYYWVFFGGRCHFDSNSSTSATAAATRYLYGALPILTDRAILSHTETHAQRVTHMCECVFVCAFKCVFLFSIRFGLRFFHSPSFSLFGFFGFATFYYLCQCLKLSENFTEKNSLYSVHLLAFSFLSSNDRTHMYRFTAFFRFFLVAILKGTK